MYHYAGNNPVYYTDPDGQEDIDAIYNKYMDLALSAKEAGASVAASNLLHFLSAEGTTVNLDSNWLRSFPEVSVAQQQCISYYENDFSTIAKNMKNGETKRLNEIPQNIDTAYGPFGTRIGYCNQQTANQSSELFYASGTFSITAFCDVKFTKKNGKTFVKGSIVFVFWDPYDWHNEFGGVVIPSKGVFWDKDANLLVENKMAAPFMMRSNWSIEYEKEF